MIEPREPTGNSANASILRQIIRFARGNRIIPGPGYKLDVRTCGTVIQLDQTGGGRSTSSPGSIAHFKILSHGSDSLVCKKWDNPNADWEAGTTTVYKPYLLRFTSAPASRVIDSITISYSAYDTTAQTRTAEVGIGGSTYTEVLTSRYLADDLIIAVYTEESGGTRWVDLNVDGRAWARKYT